MALNDVRIQDSAGHNVVPTYYWQQQANDTAINAGEPCKAKAAGSKYAVALATGEPVIGTTTAFVGIAASGGGCR